MAGLAESGAPLVVGVDGSPACEAALDWAAAEAQARGRPLRILHAFVWPMVRPAVPLGPPPEAVGEAGGLRAASEALLEQARSRAKGKAPDLEVSTRMVVGAPAPVVLDHAEDAELVVLGNRGMGGFLGLLAGSVSVAVASHAPCPVVVVPPRDTDDGTPADAGRIVVGVDGSETSAAAVEFAFERAARSGDTVVAVQAWTMPVPAEAGGEFASYVDVDDLEREARQLLEDSIAPVRERFPGVKVETKVVRAHPGHALVAESEDADLLVVGCRGRGGFKGLLLGSVSQALLHHAKCAVAVVRPRG